MLLYCNRSLVRVVLHASGSVFWRRENLAAGATLAVVSACMQLLSNMGSHLAPKLPHHYGIMVLGSVVGFAVVFRTNLGWQRYWESVTQLHFMYSKWADAYTQMNAFAQVTIEQTLNKGGEGSQQKMRRVRVAVSEMETHFSVLSALAAHRLSHGDTNRMERRADIARWGQQIVLRRDLRIGEDLTGATKLPGFVTVSDDYERSRSQTLFSNWHTSYVIGKSPSAQEVRALEKSTDRVNMAMYWIVHGLAKISKDIDIAPPIQSRMYQELSNGMLGYNNALKIADVPFPFPYAQLLSMLLIVFSFFLPVYMTVFTDSMLVGPLLSFVMFQGIWGLNEVAKELENPFGEDTNDISLSDFHARFIDVISEVNRSTAVVDKIHDSCEQKAGGGKLGSAGRIALCPERNSCTGRESRPDTVPQGAEQEKAAFVSISTSPHSWITRRDMEKISEPHPVQDSVEQAPPPLKAGSAAPPPMTDDSSPSPAASVAVAAMQQQPQSHMAGTSLPTPPATATSAPCSGKVGKIGNTGALLAQPIEKPHVQIVEPDSVVLPIQESTWQPLSGGPLGSSLGPYPSLQEAASEAATLAVKMGSAAAGGGGNGAAPSCGGPGGVAGCCPLLAAGSDLTTKVDNHLHLAQVGACVDRQE